MKDDYLLSIMRSIFSEILYQMGKKILNGSFNLTTISFPIKSMVPATFLEVCAVSFKVYSYHLEIAANQQDNLERFKWMAITLLAGPSINIQFYKPVTA